MSDSTPHELLRPVSKKEFRRMEKEVFEATKNGDFDKSPTTDKPIVKSVYVAWITYMYGSHRNLLDIFSTPELAQEACLAHYQKENFTDKSLDWSRARNIVYHATAQINSYGYEVRQEVLDPVITYPATT